MYIHLFLEPKLIIFKLYNNYQMMKVAWLAAGVLLIPRSWLTIPCIVLAVKTLFDDTRSRFLRI